MIVIIINMNSFVRIPFMLWNSYDLIIIIIIIIIIIKDTIYLVKQPRFLLEPYFYFLSKGDAGDFWTCLQTMAARSFTEPNPNPKLNLNLNPNLNPTLNLSPNPNQLSADYGAESVLRMMFGLTSN